MINKIWSRQGLSAFWPDDLDVNSSARGHMALPINAESDIVRDKMRGKQTRTRLGTRPPAYYDVTGTYRYIPPGHTNKCSHCLSPYPEWPLCPLRDNWQQISDMFSLSDNPLDPCVTQGFWCRPVVHFVTRKPPLKRNPMETTGEIHVLWHIMSVLCVDSHRTCEQSQFCDYIITS